MRSHRLSTAVMALILSVIILSTLTTPILAQTATPGPTLAPPTGFKVVAYYSSYNIYERQYMVTDIPAQQITHLNYAAMDVSDAGQCVSSDVWADEQFSYPGDTAGERLRGNFKQLQILRKNHPSLKILMTVGGWEKSKNFSNAALNDQSRARFAKSCVTYMKSSGFDGIDLDWRYPVSGGNEKNISRPEDRDNYTLLLAAVRAELDTLAKKDNRPYLLTIATPAVEPLYHNLQLDQIQNYVDWFNLMSYSFQGSWSTLASPASPLYGSTKDPRGETVQRNYNVDGAVKAYLDAGIPASKIVVGVAFYGQAWSGVKPNDYFGLYQPASGVPPGTRPGGLLYYRDLLPLLKDNKFTHFFDEETKVPWLFNPNTRVAISYEDAASIPNKTAYVRSMGLGGMMIWELSFDDDEHTLLNAVNSGLAK